LRLGSYLFVVNTLIEFSNPNGFVFDEQAVKVPETRNWSVILVKDGFKHKIQQAL